MVFNFNAMKHRVPILKRVIPSIKKRWAILRSQNGYFLVRSEGAVFLLNTRNFVDRQIAFYDDFERAQRDRLFSAFDGYADLFLDIGANIGYYSVLAAQAGIVPKVIAFEPDPRNLRQLNANVLVNGLGDAVEIIDAAASSEAGHAAFKLAPDGVTGQSKIAEGAAGGDVATVRVDDCVPMRGSKVLIKIDVEGHEIDVIKGMRDVIHGNEVYCQVECYRDQIPKLISLMESFGMRSIGSIEHDYYFTNAD